MGRDLALPTSQHIGNLNASKDTTALTGDFNFKRLVLVNASENVLQVLWTEATLVWSVSDFAYDLDFHNDLVWRLLTPLLLQLLP